MRKNPIEGVDSGGHPAVDLDRFSPQKLTQLVERSAIAALAYRFWRCLKGRVGHRSSTNSTEQKYSVNLRKSGGTAANDRRRSERRERRTPAAYPHQPTAGPPRRLQLVVVVEDGVSVADE
ncbi:MAG: hypothetical protein AAGA56_29275, partial [Myxococcota bacterium]